VTLRLVCEALCGGGGPSPPGMGGGVVHGPMWASALAGYVSASASMEEGMRTCGIGMQRCGILALSIGGLGHEVYRGGHRTLL
jgi:hypothetical protein